MSRSGLAHWLHWRRPDRTKDSPRGSGTPGLAAFILLLWLGRLPRWVAQHWLSMCQLWGTIRNVTRGHLSEIYHFKLTVLNQYQNNRFIIYKHLRTTSKIRLANEAMHVTWTNIAIVPNSRFVWPSIVLWMTTERWVYSRLNNEHKILKTYQYLCHDQKNGYNFSK